MWSTIAFCFCVSLAYATANPAWRKDMEYEYDVDARTVTSLHEITDRYSGVTCKATLKIQPRSDKNLRATLTNFKCAQIHMPLRDGWKSHIPESELAWKPLACTTEPFQIRMENGAIKGIIVNKRISNWEANMIKGVVSQLHLKLTEKPVASPAFKVVEDTVTGSTETFYKIVKLPDHIIQNEPNGQQLLMEKREEDVYEVTKEKNYTNSIELPSYFYGFSGLEQGSPATNQMGTFLSRNSFSRAVILGKMNRYTIRNSFTVNEILVYPTLIDKEQGSVYSMVNVTLKELRPQGEKMRDVTSPVHLDNLVYSYGKPFERSNLVRQKNYQNFQKFRMTNEEKTNMITRLKRSLEDSEFLLGSEESYKQEDPDLQEAPESPLLRFTSGYQGISIKEKIDVTQKVKQFAREIAEESRDSQSSLKEGTLNKFTILTSLVRIMNVNEIKEAVNDVHGKGEQDSWKILRDSVAESGTGPALLVMWDWIKTGKVEGVETSLLLATMTRAVRQPSLQYMRTYFDMIKDPVILSKWPENDTAILSFSQLLRQVYVDKRESSIQYPVKSFRNFRSAEGVKLLNETIIPYVIEQLHSAISRADTHKIHVYIRALGNVGMPQILSAFEPYLEGEKQASQFQRLLMVLAMDRLAEEYPAEARSVLMRLYLNSGETEEVRIASVYQLIRTNPPSDILQFMASYTHSDVHEHVNAAVKSAIETISRLEGQEFLELRLSAEAAKPLLTKKEYGVQFGANYLHQHVIEELRMKVKEHLQIIGSEDHYYPKGMKASVQLNSAGLKKKLWNVQAIVSSVKDLTNVLQQQTSDFSKKQQQQKQNSQEQLQHQWSSLKIAEILKLKPEEREQLEGLIYLADEFAETMFSFDNNTIHKLIEELGKFETEMQNGKDIHFMRMSNTYEMAVAFPTEMGFPFLYTYDTPELVKVQGRVKKTAGSRITQDKLELPERVQFEANLEMKMASKVQGHISFITPYDHQQYVSGFSKMYSVNIPLKGTFEVDTNTMQMKAEFERENSYKPTVLFHHSTSPFIARFDLLKLETDSDKTNPNTHIIEQKKQVQFEKKFGAKETGLTVKVRVEQEKPLFDLSKMNEIYNKEGAVPALLALWTTDRIQKSDITIRSLPQECSTHKTVISLGYRSMEKENMNAEQDEALELKAGESVSSEKRQTNAILKVIQGIKDSRGEAIDLSVEFQGVRKILYTLTAAQGRNIDNSKSKTMLKYERQTDKQDEEPYVVVVKVENSVENSNGPNLKYSLENEPKMTSDVEVAFGALSQRLSKIRGKLEFERSAARKEFLQEQPLFKQCHSEMRKGNNYLPACINMTISANRFDRIEGELQYENIPLQLQDALRTVYHAAQYEYFPSIVSEWQKESTNENEMCLRVEFDPDLRSANISVGTQEKELTFKNMLVNEWTKEILVSHPVFSVRDRFMGKALKLSNYRPYCVVDKTKISTFNNQTFPEDLSDKWTLMFQYIPKRPRFEETTYSVLKQLQEQSENYAVLIKRRSENEKEIKVTISSPETEFKVVDITMTPQSSSDVRAKVAVNGNEVQVDGSKSYDYANGYLQIFKLPKGEVKIKLSNLFSVIYDGERAQLTVSNGKFRDGVRGICGQLNGHQIEDFLTPANCIVKDSHKFIKSYEVEGSQGEEMRQHLKSCKNMECVRKNLPLYVDVITAPNKQSWSEQMVEDCTAFQTQYFQENGQMCFTTRPMPVCVRGCEPTALIEKNVPVHCIQKSRVSQIWKTQIDNGRSPDFSGKPESKTVPIRSPESCA